VEGGTSESNRGTSRTSPLGEKAQCGFYNPLRREGSTRNPNPKHMTNKNKKNKKTKKTQKTKKKKNTRKYIKEMMEWEKNNCKSEAAKNYAKEKQWEFKILTENELF